MAEARTPITPSSRASMSSTIAACDRARSSQGASVSTMKARLVALEPAIRKLLRSSPLSRSGCSRASISRIRLEV